MICTASSGGTKATAACRYRLGLVEGLTAAGRVSGKDTQVAIHLRAAVWHVAPIQKSRHDRLA